MEKLFKAIDGMKDYILELQTKMTSLPAMSPEQKGGKGEYRKAQYLESELRKLKFDEIFHVDAPCPSAEGGVRPNIVARYYGKNRDVTLWFLVHMDVVPEGDRSLWKTDPFKLTLDADGDTIYGRGVEDNQQAISAALTSAKAVMESGVEIPVNLGIMLLSDEETGNEAGIYYVIDKRPDLFGKNDSFLVQDTGDPQGREVEIAEKNVFWIKFTTEGKQCHGSMPASGNNAFYAGTNLILRLKEGFHAKFNKRDPLFSPDSSTFEPTKKEANVPNVNTIPGTDVFYMDCRILPSYEPEVFFDELKSIVKKTEEDFKVKISWEIVYKAVSKATPADAQVVKLYCDAVREVNKVEPKVLGVGGGTFAAEVRNLDLPAVVGCKIYACPHVPNEKSSLKFTLDDAKVITYVLMHFK